MCMYIHIKNLTHHTKDLDLKEMNGRADIIARGSYTSQRIFFVQNLSSLTKQDVGFKLNFESFRRLTYNKVGISMFHF